MHITFNERKPHIYEKQTDAVRVAISTQMILLLMRQKHRMSSDTESVIIILIV